MQENIRKLMQPIGVLLISFSIIIFSLNKIINMASQENDLNSLNNQTVKPINKLLSNYSNLDYNSLKKAMNESPQLYSFFSDNQHNLPDIKNLTTDQQNVVVRSILIERKNELMMDQINQNMKTNKSLIFNICFWIYSILAWGASISGGLVLKYWTEKLITKCWGKLE